MLAELVVAAVEMDSGVNRGVEVREDKMGVVVLKLLGTAEIDVVDGTFTVVEVGTGLILAVEVVARVAGAKPVKTKGLTSRGVFAGVTPNRFCIIFTR